MKESTLEKEVIILCALPLQNEHLEEKNGQNNIYKTTKKNYSKEDLNNTWKLVLESAKKNIKFTKKNFNFKLSCKNLTLYKKKLKEDR